MPFASARSDQVTIDIRQTDSPSHYTTTAGALFSQEKVAMLGDGEIKQRCTNTSSYTPGCAVSADNK